MNTLHDNIWQTVGAFIGIGAAVAAFINFIADKNLPLQRKMKHIGLTALVTVMIICGILLVDFLGTSSVSSTASSGSSPTKSTSASSSPQPGSTSTQAVSTQVTPSRLLPVKVPFAVYTDYADANNHYPVFSPTGDGKAALNDNWTENPHQGTSCIQVIYPKNSNRQAWAGFEFQDSASNWGKQSNAGFNLSHTSRLSFWIRGNSGGERIAFQMGGVGYDNNGNKEAPYADSLPAMMKGPITLTPQWQQETIDLTGQDLTRVSGGFAFSVVSGDNPNGATFYLDDIVYLA